jgi:putative ABC transport system permease protein
MRQWLRFQQLIRTVFRGRAIERELDDEVNDWVATLAERHQAAGLPPDAARRAALSDIGGADHIKEEIRSLRNGSQLDSLVLDVRYGWRGLWKARGLTAVIVITLALGIGTNTAIFSIVHAMLLEPLPYRDADRLVFIWSDMTQAGYPRAPLSGPELRDLREGSTTCSDFAGIWSNTVALTGDADPEQLRIGLVTANFFQVLGVESALGRTFQTDDSAPGAGPTILLGWGLFQRRFGGDASIIGRKILVNDGLTTVVGVMPESFRLLLPPDSSVPDHLQAWQPFGKALERGPRQNRLLRVVGRMRPGVSIAAARDDVARIARRISRDLGTEQVFTTVALQADDVQEIRGPLLALFAGVVILLAIACVNIASLLIARAASRGRETALRLALGASRGRLVRQSLVEGLLLTLLGAGAGVLAGYAGLRVLLAVTPESLSRISAARIDPTVLAFTLGISVFWGLLLSFAPIGELFRAEADRSLQPHSRTSATSVRYRTRAGLVVVQIALSVVLLVSAGLLVRAFVEVLRVDAGFRADRQLTFRIAIPGKRYESQEAINTFADQLLRRLAALPDVASVGAISHLPYDDLPNWGLPYSRDAPIPADAPNADVRAISTGLFETLGVRLIEGRFFTDADQNPNRPVAIVDDKLARLLFPNHSALGQQFVVRRGSPNARVTVVGVVRHLKLRSLVDDLTAQMFLPWPAVGRNPMAYVVRTVGDPSTLVSGIRAALVTIDPRIPIYDVRPMDAYMKAARSTRRFTMLLAGAFALSALLLTCVGVYGVLAFAVANRRHEFGVRRALGADARQVMREVLREGLGFAVAGCVGGLAGATIAARLLQSQLYTVHQNDPITYSTTLAVICCGAGIASWIPARRVTRTSPMDAMRTN